MTKITDGTGTGKQVHVDNDNRFATKAVVISEEEFVSAEKGQVYCGTTGLVPITNPDGCILYLKNTSSTHRLAIEKLLVSFSASGAMMSCQRNDTGTAGDTTAVDQVNTNFTSGNTAAASLFKPSGTSITGLTDGRYIAVFHDLGANKQEFPVDGTFILPQGSVFTVIITDGAAGAYTGDISWILRYRFVEAL